MNNKTPPSRGINAVQQVQRHHRPGPGWILVCAAMLSFPMLLCGNAFAYDGESLWQHNVAPQGSGDSATERNFWSVSDGNGGVVTVWAHEIDFLANQYTLHAQRLDHAGNQLWANGGVSIGGGTRNIVVTSDRQGGVLVAWTTPYGGDYRVVAARVDASGTLQWTADVCYVNCTLADTDISIMADGYGGAVVGYNRTLTLISDTGVVSLRDGLDAGSNLVEIVPSTSPYAGKMRLINDENQYVVGFAPFLAHGAFAVWREIHDVQGDLVSRLYARHIYPDIAGALQMSAPVLLGDIHRDADYSAVSDAAATNSGPFGTLAGGGLLITWKAGNLDIVVNRMQQSGAAGGMITVLNTTTISGDWYLFGVRQQVPQIISAGPGGSIIAWHDRRDPDPAHLGDIYMQRFDASGAAQWTPNGIPLAPDSQNQGSVRLASDGADGALATWSDKDYEGAYHAYGIRVARVAPTGKVLWSDWRYEWPTDRVNDIPQVVFDASGPAPAGALWVWRRRAPTENWNEILAEKLDQTAPGNDVCGLPLDVGEGTHPGALSRASADGSTSCTDTSGSASVWYRFTAPANGILHANTCGTNDLGGTDRGIDTVLSMHGACPGDAASQLNCDGGSCCNDDFQGGFDPTACSASDQGALRDSALVRTVSANESVLLRVAHHAGSYAGAFRLNLTLDATDSDGDGLPDSVENLLGTRTDLADSDKDGVSDFDEVNRDGDWTTYTPGSDTDPGNDDTDGDGLLDGVDPNPLVFDATVTEQVPLPLFAQLLLGLLLTVTARQFARRGRR